MVAYRTSAEHVDSTKNFGVRNFVHFPACPSSGQQRTRSPRCFSRHPSLRYPLVLRQLLGESALGNIALGHAVATELPLNHTTPCTTSLPMTGRAGEEMNLRGTFSPCGALLERLSHSVFLVVFYRDRDDPPRERFSRRADNFYGPHHSPKRRKLESGEIEAMGDFPHSRRPLFSNTYEHSAGNTAHLVHVWQRADDCFDHRANSFSNVSPTARSARRTLVPFLFPFHVVDFLRL